MGKLGSSLIVLTMLLSLSVNGQPNWEEIKNNATFNVPDDSYAEPYLQPINVPGWEDGLYMTRDGKNLYSTYLPLDVFSWLGDFVLDPECFDFGPYFRPPLLDIDTVTNVFGCPNFVHSDIVISQRASVDIPFVPWVNSNLKEPFSFDGGACGVLKDPETFDVFVFTMHGEESDSPDLRFMKDVPINPTNETAVTILSTAGNEDNPHIERLDETTLLLFFDRDRYMYYAISSDNGDSWAEPTLITSVLNDQAPYDVQPHLWNDGLDWWVYFCAENDDGIRCIYRSKQMVADNWDSWGERELVVEPNFIIPDYGYIFGIGEPTLSEWGDLSFVVVYGDTDSEDTTDVFDCDPWFIAKKDSPLSGLYKNNGSSPEIELYPNPAQNELIVSLDIQNEAVPFQCYDSMGKLVLEFSVTEPKSSVDISSLPDGVYLLKSDYFGGLARKFVKTVE